MYCRQSRLYHSFLCCFVTLYPTYYWPINSTAICCIKPSIDINMNYSPFYSQEMAFITMRFLQQYKEGAELEGKNKHTHVSLHVLLHETIKTTRI